jgi:hypothetical protein
MFRLDFEKNLNYSLHFMKHYKETTLFLEIYTLFEVLIYGVVY